MQWREGSKDYNNNTKKSIWGPLGEKLLSRQCLRKSWTMVGVDLENSYEQSKRTALQAKRNNNSPAKHPVDYKRVQEEPIGVLQSQSTLRNKSPSPNQVQKQHEDRRTVGSANYSEDAASAHQTLQDNQPVFGFHCGTTRLHERDNMATTPTTIPTREAEEATCYRVQPKAAYNKQKTL